MAIVEIVNKGWISVGEERTLVISYTLRPNRKECF